MLKLTGWCHHPNWNKAKLVLPPPVSWCYHPYWVGVMFPPQWVGVTTPNESIWSVKSWCYHPHRVIVNSWCCHPITIGYSKMSWCHHPSYTWNYFYACLLVYNIHDINIYRWLIVDYWLNLTYRVGLVFKFSLFILYFNSQVGVTTPNWMKSSWCYHPQWVGVTTPIK